LYHRVRKKFKHAEDFGVIGNPNRKNFELFKDKMAELLQQGYSWKLTNKM